MQIAKVGAILIRIRNPMDSLVQVFAVYGPLTPDGDGTMTIIRSERPDTVPDKRNSGALIRAFCETDTVTCSAVVFSV